MLIKDVVIVGAGPAGAFCALQLAEQGLHPIILDHSHPREKPCGGGISPKVTEKFPIVEKFRSIGKPFGDIRIVSCVGTAAVIKGLDSGFCISRESFDQGILDLAVLSGARLLKEKVTDLSLKGRNWVVKTQKLVLETKVVIGADGANSLVRHKMIGPISGENMALAFGYRASCNSTHRATIKLLAEIPGYIWLFPGKDFSNIGIGSEIRYGNKLKPLLDSYIKSEFNKSNLFSTYSAMLPSASTPKFFDSPCASDNWILVGDAAGHVDPISGGGLLYALWGGQLAAQAVANNDPKSFDTFWRKQYGQELIERCKRKSDFYDPLKSTIAILLGLFNGTYFFS
jgi:menaquinone-9 beta-reductase